MKPAFPAYRWGEVWKGIHLLPEGRRKRTLGEWVEGIENDYADRLLDLDADVLKAWGKLYAKHEAKGFNMGILDSLLAATACWQRQPWFMA